MEQGWRGMVAEDLPAMVAIAAIVHPRYFEEAAILAERRALYPAGCLILESGTGPAGYVLSHPWRFAAPPPLNCRLGALPARPATYYLHDLALLPEARGRGAARDAVAILAAQARSAGFSTMSLVAVNHSEEFWRRLDFESLDRPDLAATLAAYDSEARYMVRVLAGP